MESGIGVLRAEARASVFRQLCWPPRFMRGGRIVVGLEGDREYSMPRITLIYLIGIVAKSGSPEATIANAELSCVATLWSRA